MSDRGARFELSGVQLVFNGKAALDSVDVTIEAGEIVAFVGPSGAGKTSLLRLLNNTYRPTRGTVTVDNRPLTELSDRELTTLRADLGFVHQNLDLVPNLRVAQNVLAGRLGRMSFWRSLRAMIYPPREDLRRVYDILDRVGIPEKLFERTDRLSGGQQQRVAIARTLYQDARALLVDEPVSSLDPTRGRDTIDLLTSVARESGMTLVASMHDLALAREFFPRLVGMRRGRIEFDQPPKEISLAEFDELYRLDSEEMLEDGC